MPSKFRLGEIVKDDYQPGFTLNGLILSITSKLFDRFVSRQMDSRPERFLTAE